MANVKGEREQEVRHMGMELLVRGLRGAGQGKVREMVNWAIILTYRTTYGN